MANVIFRMQDIEDANFENRASSPAMTRARARITRKEH